MSQVVVMIRIAKMVDKMIAAFPFPRRPAFYCGRNFTYDNENYSVNC